VEVQLGHAVLLSRVAAARGGGASAIPLKKPPSIKKAADVSLIGQPAPLIVIALALETAPEWCLADETRRRQKP
jgi:hypothetical protein